MASYTWFVEQLESIRLTFDNDTYPLPKHPKDAFKVCYELLKEDVTSLAKRSKQRRSMRLRARNLLMDVFKSIGRDTFLLCILTTYISTLATIKIKNLAGQRTLEMLAWTSETLKAAKAFESVSSAYCLSVKPSMSPLLLVMQRTTSNGQDRWCMGMSCPSRYGTQARPTGTALLVYLHLVLFSCQKSAIAEVKRSKVVQWHIFVTLHLLCIVPAEEDEAFCFISVSDL
jgi:hypothetical protein